jgi:hypothetical protein
MQPHLPSPASGWAATAYFGPGGTRWAGSGPCLRVVAVNPQRGTGSSSDARLDLLRRAVEQSVGNGPCVFLTSAGFFGCAAPAGDKIADIYWHGDLDLRNLDGRIGDLAFHLPADRIIGVGVEQSYADADQRIWWYSGGSRTRNRETVRGESSMTDRRIEVGGFRLLAFVCGELCDGGSGFDAEIDTTGIDVVLDAAHASVARAWDREAAPQRFMFQRAFRTLGQYCGGMLAQAHEVDAGDGHARRQDNWVVYRGEPPFPEVEIVPL